MGFLEFFMGSFEYVWDFWDICEIFWDFLGFFADVDLITIVIT